MLEHKEGHPDSAESPSLSPHNISEIQSPGDSSDTIELSYPHSSEIYAQQSEQNSPTLWDRLFGRSRRHNNPPSPLQAETTLTLNIGTDIQSHETLQEPPVFHEAITAKETDLNPLDQETNEEAVSNNDPGDTARQRRWTSVSEKTDSEEYRTLQKALQTPMSRRTLLKAGLGFGAAAVMNRVLPENAFAALPVDAFKDTYEKTKDAGRIWGEQLTGNMRETYEFSDPNNPFSVRPVRYYSKGRMDVNPNEKEYHDWFVKSGLLVQEMLTGRMQVGDNKFIDIGISNENIVGDPDRGNITYKSIATANTTDRDILQSGQQVIKTVDLSGNVRSDRQYEHHGVTITRFVPETGHGIAGPLWESMQKDGKNYNDNPFYFTGYPVSEPYWSKAMVDGVERDVLVQAFERRTLTYTPDNSSEWRTEAGNAGLHYLQWRYDPEKIHNYQKLETQPGQSLNPLDFMIPNDLSKSLTGSHNLSTVYDEAKRNLYFVKATAGSYEKFEIAENGNIYLRSDHSNGNGEYYTFTNGLILKKDMKVGEAIKSPDNIVNFYDNNGKLEKTMPFPIEITLLGHKNVYLGGDLGERKVMVYRYGWGPNDEVFYFDEEHGWVMWELYKKNGLLEHNAIFNKISNSVTQPAL
ncbi:MAG TPA: hypothetical protein PLD54_03545 [Candidatus Levybacteria bacterium]|nr:hypothetical protein [Candidatus Levybacteria bacterium]